MVAADTMRGVPRAINLLKNHITYNDENMNSHWNYLGTSLQRF